MLAILASVTPSLSLSHAESRVGSEARSRFCAAVSSPSAKAFELALLMAAEERPTEDVASISCEVDAIVERPVGRPTPASAARVGRMSSCEARGSETV